MPTQLELIISAIEMNGPMTAEELAAVLKENGSNAERPENTVLSLVHKCRDVVNLGGSPSRYGLREAFFAKGGASVPQGQNDALTALCDEMEAREKHCRSEADVREKIVVPVLRDWLGFSVVGDMDFEPFLNDEKGERPDILVRNGKKRLFFVEIKKIGSDLSKALPQVKRYFRMADRPAVHVAVLTDGIRWRFFLREMKAGIPEPVQYLEFSMKDAASSPRLGDFRDALSDLSKPLFNIDILKENARRMIADSRRE